MMRYTMHLDGKSGYFENDYTVQSNLEIQSEPYQMINAIFSQN